MCVAPCNLRDEVQSASLHHQTDIAKGNSLSAPVMESCSVEVGGLSSSCGAESCVQFHAVSKALDLFPLMPWKEHLGPYPLLLSPTCSNLMILM